MKNTLLSWDGLRALLTIAEKGSLTHAADSLGVSVATLGRRIDALEASTGAALLKRGPYGAKVTPEGAKVLELVRPGAEYLHQIDRVARSFNTQTNAPPVRISSTEPMIANVLAPSIPMLTATHPAIKIELETSLELSNLNRGDADIAIRMIKPTGDTLMTRRLPPIRMGLFAKKSYLANRRLQHIDLKEETLVWYDNAYGDIAENVWLKKQGLDEQTLLRAGSVHALMNMALAGVGIAPLPIFLARHTELIELPGYRLPDRTPWLVFHRSAKNIPQIKAVRTWIVEACQKIITE